MIVSKKRTIPLFIVVSLVIGVLSVLNLSALMVLLGTVIYFGMIFIFTNEKNIKKVIPPYLILILFQDTIMVNIGIYIPMLSLLFSYLDELFIFVCLPALIINFFRGKEIVGRIILIAVMGLLTLGFISSFINDVPVIISVKGALLLTKGLLFAFIFANLSFSEQDINKFVQWIKYAAILVLGFALVDLIFPHQFRALMHTDNAFDYRSSIVSVISLFIHPGIYGWFMVFVTIYLATIFKIKSKKRYFLFASIFFSFALLSFRFKAMLAMIAVMFIFYLLKGKKALALLIPFSIVIFIAYLIAGEYITNLTQLTIDRYINADMTESARKALYEVAILIGVDKFPFGEGFGRYGGFVARDDYSPVYYKYGMDKIYGLRPDNPAFATDTYWPNLIGELGFFGAVIMFLVFLYLIIKMLKNYKKLERDNEKILILFAGLALVQGITESLGEPVFNSAPQNVFIFISLGIALALINNHVKLKRNEAEK